MFRKEGIIMWILLALVLKTSSPEAIVPAYDKPLVFDTMKDCQNQLKEIYKEYKILQANYPVKVEFKVNDNNQEYLIYSFKPDYTKPKITTFYHCLKTYSK